MRTGLIGIYVVMLAATSLGAQESVTVEGTLVDSSCYLGMNMKANDHGSMKACGSACLTAGQPGGIVTDDGTFHAIIAPASKLAPHAGHTVRITGMVKEGVIMATKAEMLADGRYTEFDIKGMM